MSLTTFTSESEEFKQAFKSVYSRPNAPSSEIAVPCHDNRYASFLGTAFDYLFRFMLEREAVRRGIDVRTSFWVAEAAVEMMPESPDRRRWSGYVRRGREVVGDYVAGRFDDLSRLATCSQYMANLDYIVRCGQFNSGFVHRQAFGDELLRLAALVDFENLLGGRRKAILNPTFEAGGMVGGADCDIILDDEIIDVKTVANAKPELRHMAEVIGYSILLRHGAALTSCGAHPVAPRRVGLYFSRHGKYVHWDIGELIGERGLDDLSARFPYMAANYRSRRRPS